MLTYARAFPGLPEAVGTARHWTRAVLADSPLTDDAALIVTELSANAVLHAAGATFGLTLVHAPEALFVSVTDGGSSRTTPHVEEPGEDAAHGRGLALVTALAHHVHIHGDDRHGHTVVAELRLTPEPARTTPGQATRGTTTC
ncbi:ATP-binding protein [Streptomyces sp. JJ36]|uniref:ATP-binding protein n=1 Tax=Streptomyces sp. JJ36 TaxID=2736645 RepID=UPI001F2DA41B|nr:ATP-binding protein [Streptomyces sp. JJ36]MCF6525582.1 ATP-binding protein [Streptomyces sp. JJ36]